MSLWASGRSGRCRRRRRCAFVDSDDDLVRLADALLGVRHEDEGLDEVR
jgi:hypothetical protein